MATKQGLRVPNLVNSHRTVAEQFLASLIKQKAVPKVFSGVMCPKFGSYIHVWQFDKNKLVGSTLIHINNIDNFTKKLKSSLTSVDWLTISNLIKENDESGIVDVKPVS